MKQAIRYIIGVLLCMSSHLPMSAQFNPDNPAEPFQNNKVTVTAEPLDAVSSLGGDGYYREGETAYISSYRISDAYTFSHWEKDGVWFSNEETTSFVMDNSAHTFTAHYTFGPSSPDEPALNDNRLYLVAEPLTACSFNRESGQTFQSNEWINVEAYVNAGYKFLGWYKDGVKQSERLSYSFNMPSGDVNLIAKFEYNPTNPFEPESNNPQISGEEQIAMEGTTTAFPVNAHYRVSNSGKSPLNISEVTFATDGYKLNTQLPLVIEAGKNAELSITYTPTQEGEHSTTMRLHSNDPLVPTKSVTVNCTIHKAGTLVLSGENQADLSYQWTVSMNNPSVVTALQMDVHWKEGMITSSEALEATNRLAEHSHSVTDLGNGVYRVIISSTDNAAISGNTDALFTLSYTPEDGTIYQNSTVEIKNILFSDKWGNQYSPENNVSANTDFTGFFLKFTLDGKILSEQFLRIGANVSAPQPPAKEGHSFSGWGEVPTTMPARDLTFNGTYTPNKYNLIYLVDGVEHKKIEVEYGAAITPEAIPTKEGHTFSGWSNVPQTMPAKDVTITGTFALSKYTLTYTVDGKAYKTYDVEYGATITPEAAPTKEGHTFSGWSTIPNSMPAKDVTITGTFAINKYVLTYMVDGVVYKTYEVAYGATITPEAEPTKSGYAFSGWSNVPQTMPAKDVTITGSFITTGVENVASEQKVDVYTLKGVRIKRQIPRNRLSEVLQKGVYIINGKKTLVK